MIVSSAMLVASYFLASGTLMVLWRSSRAFENVKGQRRAAIALVFGPMTIAWLYGWLLRLVPGQSYQFYLIFVFVLITPGGLVQGFRLAGWLRDQRASFGWKNWQLGTLLKVAGVSAGCAALGTIAVMALKTPLFANDPLNYFFAAQRVFEYQQLIGIYPLIDPEVAAGFYGPWTHPPGFVLSIAWGYAIQGGADNAGVAQLIGVYSLGTLLLLVFAWAGGFSRFRGVVAALLVATTPILLHKAFDTHVDVTRVAMWTSVFCLLHYWFRRQSNSNNIALGTMVGLSMFVHSIGMLFWPLFLGLLLLVRGSTLASRFIHGILLALVSCLMVAPDYWQNIIQFGRLIGDSTPLWEIREFRLTEFVNNQRGIDTLEGKLGKGLLDQAWDFSLYGFTGLGAAVFGLSYLLVIMIVSRLRPLRIFRHMTSPQLLYILLLSSLGFLAAIVLSIALDMNLIIKNSRYLATMTAVYALLATIASDALFRFSVQNLKRARQGKYYSFLLQAKSGEYGPFIWTTGKFRRFVQSAVFLVVSVLLAMTSINGLRQDVKYRTTKFPRQDFLSKTIDGQAKLACSRNHRLQVINSINDKLLKGEIEGPIKVLAFRPSDVAYYAKFPFLSYLDPRLIPAYTAENPIQSYDRLKDLGLTHLLLPSYQMGEINNTAFASLLLDPNLVELSINNKGYRIFRLAGQTQIFESSEHEPMVLRPGAPMPIDVSQPDLFILSKGSVSRPVECSKQFKYYVDGNTSILSVAGRSRFQTAQKIEVDPEKAYRLSFDVRAKGDGPVAKTRIGLVRFDATGQMQRQSSGKLNLFDLVDRKIATDGKWVDISEVFIGTGEGKFEQQKDDTRFIAFMFKTNRQGTETTTEIRNLSIEEVER